MGKGGTAPKPSDEFRVALERRLVLANVAAGMLIALYFTSTSTVTDGTSAAHYWLRSSASSLAFAFVGAVVGIRIARHWLVPWLRWMDEGRNPTEAERGLVLKGPYYLARFIFRIWLVMAGLVALTQLAEPHPSLAAFLKSFAGTLLGGLTATAFSYLLSERILRPVIARVLAGEASTLSAVGVRTRLLLAWALGSGLPLLGIALTPALREPRSALPLWAPVVILAAMGLLAGATITAGVARSVADPMQDMRAAAERVEHGDLEARVTVDDTGEIGLLQAAFNDMVSGLRERERLQDLFGRHVGEDVARRALSQGAALGGEARDVSVFFVDLINSTSMTRDRPPAEVVDVLNRFFAAVVAAASDEGGWVNKFEGDGALCVFGAPAVLPDHAAAALRAAMRLHADLEALGVDAAIGVATGEVVAGNVGTESRYEYTVIGRAVNEAARLTEEAKRVPSRVLTSIGSSGWQPAGPLDLRGIGSVDTYSPKPHVSRK